MRIRGLVASLIACLTVVSWACSSQPRTREIRTYSEHFVFRLTSDPMPPHAREAVLYKIVVQDKDSRQPIESGEGRIFANNRDGTSTWDSFQKGQEVGTYYAKLRFVTAEQWAVGIEFRRDTLPTTKIERATDYQQDVGAAREP